jgi:hypothetical protein
MQSLPIARACTVEDHYLAAVLLQILDHHRHPRLVRDRRFLRLHWPEGDPLSGPLPHANSSL